MISPCPRRLFVHVSRRFACRSDSVPPLIQPESAKLLLKSKNVKFIDGSWHLDKSRVPQEEFEKERIPGAVRFDVDNIADLRSGLPHMLPSENDFASAMNQMSISNDDHVIVYGTKNCFSAPRVWWTFKTFGHNKVSVLDGGLEDWKAAGGPVIGGPVLSPSPTNTKYHAVLQRNNVVTWQEVLDIVNKGSAQIGDARSKERFLAKVPEPRPGVRGGSIPGSLCIPFSSIVSPTNQAKFRPEAEIRKVFEESGVLLHPLNRIVFSCGSGVTAAVLALGLTLTGKSDLGRSPIYDGSWTEWGSKHELPISVPDK